MSSGTGPELVAYGGGGKSHWGQVNCEKCVAWLREMPDRFEASHREEEGSDQDYVCFWTCIACGHERKVRSSSPPGEYTPNPNAELHEPGTRPPRVTRNPEKWANAHTLTPAKKRLVNRCWKMLDPLQGALTIHKVTYVWDIVKALEAQDIEAVIRSAQAYVDLLDYEAIHGVEHSSYCGVEGKVTDIRDALSAIGKGDKHSVVGSNLSRLKWNFVGRLLGSYKVGGSNPSPATKLNS